MTLLARNPLGSKFTTVAHAIADGEFITVGCNMSSDIVDLVYETFMQMMPSQYSVSGADNSNNMALKLVSSSYINGLYLPVSPRLVFIGQIDTRNFALPDEANIYVKYTGKHSDDFFVFARKIPKPPNRWASVGPSVATYAVAISSDSNGTLDANVTYVSVKSDGTVFPCRWLDGAESFAKWSRISAMAATIAINSLDEKRYLWEVQTQERLLSSKATTTLTLGVDEEHVKSLFYARDAPLSTHGRRRPILHWVEQHNRRIASGVDVDVKKHLRGIHEFRMGDVDFRITSPIKRTPA